MWKPYWKLNRNPFDESRSPFVPLDAHREAVARLTDSVEAGRRLTRFQERAGMGKSRVLAEALQAVRSPGRRVARCTSPLDGATLYTTLAAALGARVPAGASRAVAWRSLGEALRLCRWQRQHVVLAVDDCQDLCDPVDQVDLQRLVHADPHPAARLSVIQVFRDRERATDDVDAARYAEPWDLAIALPCLMRSECERYVTAKLQAAGRTDPVFTPRAFHRLHALSEGVPRTLDRLAELALMAGAARGLEVVAADLVEGVSLECGPPPY